MKLKYFLFLFILLASSCKKEMTRDDAFKLLSTQLNGYARNYSGNNDYYSVTISIKNANNEPLDKVKLEMLKCLESKDYVTLSNV
jgi:hypothetical protein